jgi:ATP-binding cassette subfamily C protein
MTSNLLFILKTLRLLREHKPGKLLLIFLLTLFQGVSGGFSVVLLIPLLQLLNVGGGEASDALTQFFLNLSARSGVTLSIELILLLYVGILAINALLQYWKSILDAGYQQTFIYQIRNRLFRKIILSDWSLLNRKSKTNHLQVLTKEVPNLANYIYFYMRLLTTLVIAGSYVAWAMAVSVKFTLLVILAGALLFFLVRKFLHKSFTYGKAHVEAYSRLLKYIDDFWLTVKIAKVHSSEDFYYAKYDEATTSLLDLEYRMQRNWSLPQLIYRMAGILVLVAVVYAGYTFGQVPLASFFILILLFARIFPQFTSINTDLNMIVTNIPSVKLVLQLDEDFADTPFAKQDNLPTIFLKQEIRLEHLYFAYPDGEQLFAGFSETIPVRQITGILGESGRGKTTLIDLIAGLQSPQSGHVLVDGQLLEGKFLSAWKNSIGYLPQDAFFIDGTFRENLVWDSRETITDKDIVDVLEQVNAAHLLNRFEKGLDEVVVNYVFNLSGGERQRLALARVLLRKPQLLLLDEATSSLDADNEQTIMEVLCRLKERVTIVFVTHRVSLLPWFDKVIKLI